MVEFFVKERFNISYFVFDIDDKFDKIIESSTAYSFNGFVKNFPSNKHAFSSSLNNKLSGHATQPTVTPIQHPTYCRLFAGSAMFPLKSGPRWGHLSGHSKVVAGFHACVVIHSSPELYKHWLQFSLNCKLNGQHA